MVAQPSNTNPNTSVPLDLHILGAYRPSSTGKTFPLVDPYTLKPVGEVASASQEDVDAAVAFAKEAQVGWSKRSAKERADLVRKWGQTLESPETAARIRQLEEYEGKTAAVSAWHIGFTKGLFGHAASLAEGDASHGHSSLSDPGFVLMTMKQPLGVTAAILPFNIPMALYAAKVAYAIAAGNSIIVKSSEKAPLLPSYLTWLAHEVGIPPGVVQHVSGGGDIGKLLAENMVVRRISFTGSTATGKKVSEAAARSNLKRVSLELGGKSPVIVFPDAPDMGDAIQACVISMATNTGQACIASSRIFVHEDIAKTFIENYKNAYGNIPAGDPRDPQMILGPIIDKLQADRVQGLLDVGKQDGKVETGGDLIPGGGLTFQPTVFTSIDDNSRINREEIFGPAVIIHTFKDEDEVVRRATDTEYGLYASVFSSDINRCLRIAQKFEAGLVGVNCTSPTISYHMPFGGWKQSGNAREYGPEALEEWLEVKSVMIKVADLK